VAGFVSYILDALKKAEHQRDIGQVPGIGSEHPGDTPARANHWLYVLLLVLVINAGLLVYALWPEPATPTRSVAASSAAVGGTQPQPAPAVKLPPVQQPTMQQSAVPQPAVPQPAVQQPAVQQPQPEPPAEHLAVSRPAPVVPTSAPPPAALRALPPLPEPAETMPVQAPTEIGSDETPAPVAHVAGINDNLPVWPQISDSLFRDINSNLRLDVHVYSKRPQERFVLINMQKYTEGERLQEGPVVDEITPEGVILSFHSRRFRVLAQ